MGRRRLLSRKGEDRLAEFLVIVGAIVTAAVVTGAWASLRP